MKEIILKKSNFLSLLMLSVFLVAALFFAATSPTDISAQALTTDNTLSQMTEEDCINFLIENGIEIPEDLIDSPELGSFIKSIIEAVKINPNYEFAYSYNVTLEFAESIKTLINNYYSIEQNRSASAVYTLQDSVKGTR